MFESGGSKQDVQKFMNDLNWKIDEITQRVENIEGIANQIFALFIYFIEIIRMNKILKN